MTDQHVTSRNDHATIIGPTCKITGDVVLDGDAAVLGEIEGSVEVSGKLAIATAGGVIGRVASGALSLEGKIVGDVRCSGAVDMDGHIEGDVVCGDTVTVGPEAVLLGDVFAKAIGINEGATYRGHIVIGPQAIAEAEKAHTARVAAQQDQQAGRHTHADSDDSMGTVGKIDRDSTTTIPTDTESTAVAGLLRRRAASRLGRTTAATA